MIFIVDNYDSFTYNLVQRLGEIDSALDVQVARNDQTTPEQIAVCEPSHVIISPGPCTPREAGISVECVRHFAGRVPLLGVCLGHQSIAEAYGATVQRAGRLMHGKTDRIRHDDTGLTAGLENPFQATRYHSLAVRPDSLPDELVECAWSDTSTGEREIMAIRHREFPLYGWQFHPESFLTHAGTELLRRFVQSR